MKDYLILMNNGIALWQKQGYGKVDFNCVNCLSLFYYIVNLWIPFSYGQPIARICQMIVAINCRQYIKSMILQTNKYNFIDPSDEQV